MKFKKVLSLAAASMMAASVVATSASADWAPVEGADVGLSDSTVLYMVTLFCNAEGDDGNIPKKDYGLDLSKLGYVTFTFHIPEEEQEFFHCDWGGGLGISLHASNIPQQPTAPSEPVAPPETLTGDKLAEAQAKYETALAEYPAKLEEYNQKKAEYDAFVAEKGTRTCQNGDEVDPWTYYNWSDAANFWGIRDNDMMDPNSYDWGDDGEIIEGSGWPMNTVNVEEPAFIEPLGDYTYRVKSKLANPVAEGDCAVEDITDVRVFLQCWSSGAFLAEVTRTVVFDLDGKPMIAFDKLGNVVDTVPEDEREYVLQPDPNEVEEPDSGDDPASAPESTPADSSTPASEPASTPASAPTSSTASESNGLPIGAIIGIIAGVVAVVVVVVVVVVKKKKG